MSTNRPRFVPLGRRLLPGVLALGLLAVFVATIAGANFGEFGEFGDVSVVSAIGYAMFDFETLQAEQGVPGTEPFLLAFLLIAIVLDAALDASLVLAKREDEGESARPAAFGDVGSSGSSTLDASAGSAGDAATGTDGGRDIDPAEDSAETPADEGGEDR
ncbi:hypothetical protein [Halovivax gelatinilyticus]|uniref:hypothetical protein n=1 Tax=Halovivax gelatinilyticus TaxID=2961597 RepID=UPI0020CA48D4|nr:hypothetical protein [Halovivax gelatinilyticus]